MSNPVINLSQVYNIFFNVQSLAVVNPDGASWVMPKAIMRVVKTDMEDDIGDKTYGQRTKCHFLFFKTIIPDNLIPQINTKITDNNGTNWYVNDIENIYFGNVLKLYCESQAGIGVQDEQFPNADNTTTTTSSSTAAPSPCQSNAYSYHDLTIDDQQLVCAKAPGLASSWTVENQPLNVHENAFISFVVDGNTYQMIDIVADATGINNGSALVTINGVLIAGGNYAGTTISYTTGITDGDIINFHWNSADPLVYGAVVAYLTTYQTTSTSTTTAGP